MKSRHRTINRASTIVLLCVFPLVAHGQVVGNAMDHIGTASSELSVSPDFAVAQVFGDFPEYSGMLIDDFYAPGVVTGVEFAFETADTFNLSNVTGWELSFWLTANDALSSGDALNGGTLFSAVLSGSYRELNFASASAGSKAYAVSFEGLNADLGIGMRYVGVAAVLDFGFGDQIFALQNSSAPVIGNGTTGDAIGINPGGGFGGTRFDTSVNAAYRVDARHASVVPEPAACVTLAYGALCLLRRRITQTASLKTR